MRFFVISIMVNKTGVKVPLPSAKAKNIAENFVLKEWQKRWDNLQTCAHTKIFWAKIDLKKSKQMLKLNRQEHGLVSRFYTGFNYTASFKSKIVRNLSPYCKSCQEVGLNLKETGEHVILHCGRWESRRRTVFEDAVNDPGKIGPLKLAKFLRKKELKELERGV